MYDSARSWLNIPPLSNLGAYKHPNLEIPDEKKGAGDML